MYLIGQIWIYLAAAFAAGALAGYGAWLWCQRRAGAALSKARDDAPSAIAAEPYADAGVSDAAEITRLKREIENIRRDAETRAAVDERRHEAEIAALRQDLAEARTRASSANQPAPARVAAPKQKRAPSAPKGPGPHRLKAPRKGKADDLTLIPGIGPALQSRLNRLGIWHFEQIAKWTPDDARLIAAELGEEGFEGLGDAWVDEAHRLATGWRPATVERAGRS